MHSANVCASSNLLTIVGKRNLSHLPSPLDYAVPLKLPCAARTAANSRARALSTTREQKPATARVPTNCSASNDSPSLRLPQSIPVWILPRINGNSSASYGIRASVESPARTSIRSETEARNPIPSKSRWCRASEIMSSKIASKPPPENSRARPALTPERSSRRWRDLALHPRLPPTYLETALGWL